MNAFRIVSAFVVCTLLLSGCQSLRFGRPGPEGPADRAFSDLLVMVEDRLELHYEGARLRWDGDRPEVYREEIDPVLVLFEARGFPPSRARSFFSAQLQAGSIVQETAFNQWEEQGLEGFDEVINFDHVLRPELQQTISRMEARLAAVEAGSLSMNYARHRLEETRQSMRESEYIPDDAVEAALSPFRYSLRVWRSPQE